MGRKKNPYVRGGGGGGGGGAGTENLSGATEFVLK